MMDISRRAIVGGALAAGLCSGGGVALAYAPLRVPPGPMRLARTLTRGLRGGAKIVVSREWEVAFERSGPELLVTGKQTAVTVEAPPALAALSEIEQNRSTDGMFPMVLDKNGALSATGEYVAGSDLQNALLEAQKMIAGSALPKDLKTAQLQGLAQFQNQASDLLSRIPRDLFFPTDHATHTIQPMELGNGVSGEFELYSQASCAPQSPWLERAERRVITRIADSERHSSDLWTMAIL